MFPSKLWEPNFHLNQPIAYTPSCLCRTSHFHRLRSLYASPQGLLGEAAAPFSWTSLTRDACTDCKTSTHSNCKREAQFPQTPASLSNKSFNDFASLLRLLRIHPLPPHLEGEGSHRCWSGWPYVGSCAWLMPLSLPE